MFNRKWVLAIAGGLLLGAASAPPAGAFGFTQKKTTYLTFSRPVALPGVKLDAGTYIFELAEPTTSWDVVRVLSRDRKHVYLTGFTQVIRRPLHVDDDTFVSFAEAAAGQPHRIVAWFPAAESTGRAFIYFDK